MFKEGGRYIDMHEAQIYIKNINKEAITLSRGGVVSQLGRGGTPPLGGCQHITVIHDNQLMEILDRPSENHTRDRRAVVFTEAVQDRL